jgi:hypothetical protein
MEVELVIAVVTADAAGLEHELDDVADGHAGIAVAIAVAADSSAIGRTSSVGASASVGFFIAIAAVRDEGGACVPFVYARVAVTIANTAVGDEGGACVPFVYARVSGRVPIPIAIAIPIPIAIPIAIAIAVPIAVAVTGRRAVITANAEAHGGHQQGEREERGEGASGRAQLFHQFALWKRWTTLQTQLGRPRERVRRGFFLRRSERGSAADPETVESGGAGRPSPYQGRDLSTESLGSSGARPVERSARTYFLCPPPHPGQSMTLRPAALFAAALLTFTFTYAPDADARDWYVSAAKGKGKKGTKEKPAKDLGNISSKLEAGDVIHIAGGVYTSKGDRGYDTINVPVSIYGGYDEAFEKRDPWGATRTILTGVNKTKNYKPEARLDLDLGKYTGKEMPPIVVDGLIIDQGPQNRYKTDKRLMLVRKANPKTGEMPTPDRGALRIGLGKGANFGRNDGWKVTVSNNIIMNSAPTQGALSVQAYGNSKVTIENNAVINCTGTGIYAATSYRGADNQGQITLKNNTVAFTWKYDAYVQSFSGNGIKVDDDVIVTATGNAVILSDRFNVMKSGNEPLLLKGNFLFGGIDATYYESNGDAKIQFADLEDEAEHLHDDSGDNVTGTFKLPVSKDWAAAYGQRVLIDRNAVEADIKPQQTRANEVRSILGLNQRADDVKADSPVWLNQMSVDDAVAVASAKVNGKYGSAKPVAK